MVFRNGLAMLELHLLTVAIFNVMGLPVQRLWEEIKKF